MNVDTMTHENEDAISVILPAFDHLVVFSLCNAGVYREELPRAVNELGFLLLIRWVVVAICYICSIMKSGRIGQIYREYLCRSPARSLGKYFETLERFMICRVQGSGRSGETLDNDGKHE